MHYWILTLALMIGTSFSALAEDKATSLNFDVAQPDSGSFLQTLKQVQELREQGDSQPVQIKIPKGTYYFTKTITLTPELVGEGLTIKAEQPGEVFFSGGILLEPQTSQAAGEFRYRLPADEKIDERPRQLIIEQRLTPAARTPNQGYFRIEAALEDRRSGFTINPEDVPANWEAEIHSTDLILLHDWSSSRLPVASFDASTRTLRTVGPIGCSAPHYAIDHFEKQPRYWLEGHPSFADLPGEWYLDSATSEIVLKAAPDQKQPPEVILPRLTEILKAAGNEQKKIWNLTLSGLTFQHAKFPMPEGGLAGAQATMHEPRDASGKRTSSGRPILAASVFLANASNCRIQNCTFSHSGVSGLWLEQQIHNCRLFRCRFDHLGGNGINLGEDNSRRIENQTWHQSAPDQISTNNLVSECVISHVGEVLPGSVGIWAPLNRQLTLSKNHIRDCPYTGISLGWMWNPSETPAGENRISANRIEFVMQVLSDGGGIYTLGRQPDSVIEQNVITDVPLNAGRAESNGMFLDEGSTGFLIRQNEIRRIDKSPFRFHKAGENHVVENRYELATESTPLVRFNNTPEKNIHVQDNQQVEPQKAIYLIGNSLTADTLPWRLTGNVHWHVDCGKSLTYIQTNPSDPCVSTSRLWPTALNSTQYDYVSFQPHYGTTIEEDVTVISQWVEMQPKAIVVLHTGWAKVAQFNEEFSDADPAGRLTHSKAYYDELLKHLKERFPEREFRCTNATYLLHRIEQDIASGKAPFQKLEDIYRDAIHMTTGAGRYLMHNRMRQVMEQPRTSEGFQIASPEVKAYLDQILDENEDQLD